MVSYDFHLYCWSLHCIPLVHTTWLLVTKQPQYSHAEKKPFSTSNDKAPFISNTKWYSSPCSNLRLFQDAYNRELRSQIWKDRANPRTWQQIAQWHDSPLWEAYANPGGRWWIFSLTYSERSRCRRKILDVTRSKIWLYMSVCVCVCVNH